MGVHRGRVQRGAIVMVHKGSIAGGTRAVPLLDVCVREPIMDPLLDVCVRVPIMDPLHPLVLTGAGATWG